MNQAPGELRPPSVLVIEHFFPRKTQWIIVENLLGFNHDASKFLEFSYDPNNLAPITLFIGFKS